MRSILLLPLALILGTAAQGGLDEDGILRCGTESTTPPFNSSLVTERQPRRRRPPITIELYMHFIGPDDTTPQDPLRITAGKQLEVLNDAYRKYDISFTMPDENVWFWTDAFHASIQSKADFVSMVKTYREGDTKTLNLFIPKSPNPKLGLGMCTSIDSLFMDKTAPLSYDGCFINANSLPGSTSKKYNQGKTAVHEVGHWLGLMHTFDGGCTGPGDHISDTPAQAHATYTCDDPLQNTCPLSPGRDPIHNYMGYSYDSCMTEFTRHQTKIMHYTWRRFRNTSP